jgi:succinate dehydrogenase / fumarate reductase cytochrome b subunit
LATTQKPPTTMPPGDVEPVRASARDLPWPLSLYRTAVGKKYVMAITGIAWMGYVLAHMVGNLKLYMGAEEINHYGEFLRELLVPILPRTVTLWLMRTGLIVAILLHVHAAWALTRMNHRADRKYASRRDFVAANFASRTMRWTGIIVGAFILFHLADLTWGWANPDFVRGDIYNNMTESLTRVPVALFYIVATLALGVHLWHGAWSMFQSMGWNNPRFNRWRSWFAWGFAVLIVLGNLSFPLAIVTGAVD